MPMLKINLRDHLYQDSAVLDVDAIGSVLLSHGYSSHGAEQILAKLAFDLARPASTGHGESSAQFIANRLKDSWGVDLIVGWEVNRDPPIDEKMGYKSAWVSSQYTIAFRQPYAETMSLMRARLEAYEKVFGCANMTTDQILNMSSAQHPPLDDGAGNRSKAQFDEPDEPSLFVAGDDERLNPEWVRYTTNYHRGLLTQEQVINVGNNMLVQIQQASEDHLRTLGPRGIPAVLTKYGHVSMAWVIYFKNTHQPDLNFGQITRMGLTVAEQVKAYTPRG